MRLRAVESQQREDFRSDFVLFVAINLSLLIDCPQNTRQLQNIPVKVPQKPKTLFFLRSSRTPEMFTMLLFILSTSSALLIISFTLTYCCDRIWTQIPKFKK